MYGTKGAKEADEREDESLAGLSLNSKVAVDICSNAGTFAFDKDACPDERVAV